MRALMTCAALVVAVGACGDQLPDGDGDGDGGAADAGAADAGAADAGAADGAVPDAPDGGSGDGGEPPVSGIQVSPLSIDFGTVVPGACTSKAVVFESLHGAYVTIQQLEMVALSQNVPPDAAFLLDTEAPFTVGPGDGVAVGVSFCPEDQRLHLGKLHWISTDGRNPDGDVVLSGQGGGP